MKVREVRDFSKRGDALPIPNLIDIQIESYQRFLQKDVEPSKRRNEGLEAILRESFPIASYDGNIRLEYVSYELGEPRYTVDECRALRQTYGMPFRIKVRMVRKDKPEVVEDAIYLGEIPIMIGGGEFIINGAERVIVSQLHRSPGIDLLKQSEGDRPLHGFRIVPDRGSWIEAGVTKKETLAVKIDQSAKIPCTTFLRALDEKYGTTEAIIREFYAVETVKVGQLKPEYYAVAPIVDAETGEVVVKAGAQIGEALRTLQSGSPAQGQVKPPEDQKEKISEVLLAYGRKHCKPYFEVEDEDAKQLVQKDPLALLIAVLCMRPIAAADSFSVPVKLRQKLGRFDARTIADASLEDIKSVVPGLAGTGCAQAIKDFCQEVQKKFGGDVSRTYEGKTTAADFIKWFEQFGASEFRIAPLAANMLHRNKVHEFPDPESIDVAADRQVAKAMACLGLIDEETAERAAKPGPGGNTARRRVQEIARELNPAYPGALDAPLWDLGRKFGEDAEALRDKLGVRDLFRRSPSPRQRRADSVDVVTRVSDPLILNTIAEDPADSHEAALLRIYAKLRPGNPPQLDKARTLFHEKFFDENRYRLGRVGRFRINRKFKQSVPETVMTLRSEDVVNSIKYIMGLRRGEGHTDDIDHLGNRRLRTIDELAAEEIRKGFLKLKKTIQERMSLRDPAEIGDKVAELVNSKSISSAIEFFFGRGELSQVVDQTNPLSQLTHERRLSALGPGGLNRKRAGFEVRDVHISHYGRICPIETPEGTNIGLIASLAIYADIDEYGFLITPYRVVKDGKVNGQHKYLRADEEMEAVLGPPDIVDRDGQLMKGNALARVKGELTIVPSRDVQYVDISPRQTVSVSAALIPFLEHDDANRALMGANMQRQAVPLLRTEPPIVATGLEKAVAQNSGMTVRAERAGVVTYVDSQRILIDNADEYVLRKFRGLNERTCLNQKPVVRKGQRVKKGQIIADGPATHQGELALGRNVLVAFMTYDGYNFEDAIVISERLVKDDTFTSIHIEDHDVEIRETKLGREEFTRDIPNVSEKALANLDENGIVRVGTHVGPGDILVGKVAPKSKSELSPEEKLLHAIFGRTGEDVKNDSLELPAGEEGVVIATQRFSRRMHMTDEQKKQLKKDIDRFEKEMDQKAIAIFRQMVNEMNDVVGQPLVDPNTRQKVAQSENEAVVMEQIETFSLDWVKGSRESREQAEGIYSRFWPRVQAVLKEKARRSEHMKRGDELPQGVLEMVKVYVATKRQLSVGDKMAGRHGNKGVIARIVPEEDMPFLEDGTPVDILLNPLGVPSRMNVGQILETHLGWAMAVLGQQAVTPVFDGATEEEIFKAVEEANEAVRQRRKEREKSGVPLGPRELDVIMPYGGKITLYDGRTGQPFEQKVTVGCIYMMKLHHLVDDKIHARSTGPYSLITQQPLGGKARVGGQRFGEMEVWALEAYGAAHILQELLTVKSDDVEGRNKIYDSMVKGHNTLEAGTPVSFDVLCHEIRGLGLNIQLDKKRGTGGEDEDMY